MSKKEVRDLIVSLDIGTAKVSCLIAEVIHPLEDDPTTTSQLEVIGFGSNTSTGFEGGKVVDMEMAVHAIQAAIEAAETMADCEVHSVYASISGTHIKSFNSHGIVAISNQEVTQADILRVIDAASTVAIPAEKKVLHVLTQGFSIDQHPLVQKPLGMSGVRLEANIHVITGGVSVALNIEKCIERCGLEVADMAFGPLAESYALLSAEDRIAGICLVDIGAGTTGLAIFAGGSVCHTAVMPLGGMLATKDIAAFLNHCPVKTAEQIKLEYGCVLREFASTTKRFSLPNLPREVSQMALAYVIEERYQELLKLVHEEIKRSGLLGHIPLGIVFTGGATKIPHFIDLAKREFDMPVKIGVVNGIMGPAEIMDDPVYTTGLGLLQYAKVQENQGVAKKRAKFKLGGGLVAQLRGWFQRNF